MKQQHISVTLLGTLIMTLALMQPAAAVVYKYTGNDGKVIYSQTPPTDRPFTVVETKGNDASKSGEARKKIDELKEAQAEGRAARQQESADAKRDREDREIRNESCKLAQANLKALQQTGRVKIKEGDKYQWLTEEARQERITAENKRVEEFCK